MWYHKVMTARESRRIKSGKVKLAAVLSVPEGAAVCVVLSHGFTSSKDGRTCLALEERLNAEGLATLRYDFFGHGESGGAFREITLTKAVANLESVIGYVRARGFSKIGLFGSSFGGMVTTLVASKQPELLAVVLKSPVSDYEGKERAKYGAAGIDQWKRVGSIDREKGDEPGLYLNYSFFEDTMLHDGYAACATVVAPVRIIHGGADDVVPVEQSRRAAELMPSGELVELAGVGHDYKRSADFERYIDLTAEWFAAYCCARN